MANDERIKKIISKEQVEYEELLSNLVVKYYSEGFNEILFNLRDKNRLSLMRFIVMLNTKFKATGRIVPLINISSRVIETEGGFMLTDGEKTIDCTLETLIKNDEELLSVNL